MNSFSRMRRSFVKSSVMPLLFESFGSAGGRSSACGLEDQGRGIDAVAQVGRLRAVIENMPEVAAATGAMDFRPRRRGLAVDLRSDRIGEDRLPETGPTGLAVILRFGGKKQLVASGAVVGPLLFMVKIFVLIRGLGPLFSKDAVLLGGQDLPPRFFRFADRKAPLRCQRPGEVEAERSRHPDRRPPRQPLQALPSIHPAPPKSLFYCFP